MSGQWNVDFNQWKKNANVNAANCVEKTPEQVAADEAKDAARKLGNINGNPKNTGKGVKMEYKSNLDPNRQTAALFLEKAIKSAVDALKQYDKERMSFSGIGHYGDWMALLTGKKNISNQIKDMEKLLAKAQQLQNSPDNETYDMLFQEITGNSYNGTLMNRAIQSSKDESMPADEKDFAIMRAFGDLSFDAEGSITANKKEGKILSVIFDVASIIAGGGALKAIFKGATKGVAKGAAKGAAKGVAKGAAKEAAREATKKAGTFGLAGLLAACGKLQTQEEEFDKVMEEQIKENQKAEANAIVTEKDFVIAMMNELNKGAIKGEKLKDLIPNEHGIEGKIITTSDKEGNPCLALKLGSQVIPLKICLCGDPVDDGEKVTVKYNIMCGDKTLGITLGYMKDRKIITQKNVDGKEYTFNEANDKPIIEFKYKDENGKEQTFQVPIDNNDPLSLEVIVKYLKNVAGIEFPEGAQLSLGKNEKGEPGVKAEWEETSDLTEDQIKAKAEETDDYKEIVKDHSDAKITNVTYQDGQAHVVVSYNVKVNRDENVIKDELTKQYNIPEGAKFDIDYENGKVTVTYKVEKKRDANVIKGELIRQYGIPEDAKFDIDYDNGQVTVTYKVEKNRDAGVIKDELTKQYNIPEGAKFDIDYENGKVTVTYKVEKKRDANVIKGELIRQYGIPEDAKFDIDYDNGKVTVTYPYNRTYTETEFKKRHPEVPENADLKINEKTGEVIATWQLSDQEVVERLNNDDIENPVYSIVNGKVVETFTSTDGKKYTHTVDAEANTAFDGIAETLGFKGVLTNLDAFKASYRKEGLYPNGGLVVEMVNNDLDNPKYKVTINGVETEGVPTQKDGKIIVGNATLWTTEDDEVYMDIKDKNGKVYHHTFFLNENQGERRLEMAEIPDSAISPNGEIDWKMVTYCYFPLDPSSVAFDTKKADDIYKKYPRDQKVPDTVKPRTETYDAKTKDVVDEKVTYDNVKTKEVVDEKVTYKAKTKDVVDEKVTYDNVKTKETKTETEEIVVDGVKTEKKEAFYPENLTKTRDDAKKEFDYNNGIIVKIIEWIKKYPLVWTLKAKAHGETNMG